MRARYKELSLILHPDKRRLSTNNCSGTSANAVHSGATAVGTAVASGAAWGSNNVRGHESAPEFARVAEAYSVLGDPASRKRYDAEVLAAGSAQTLPVDAEVDLDEMGWDEDNACYVMSCRCSGAFVAREEDLDKGVAVFGCSGCTLSVRVLYDRVEDNDDDNDDGDCDGNSNISSRQDAGDGHGDHSHGSRGGGGGAAAAAAADATTYAAATSGGLTEEPLSTAIT